MNAKALCTCSALPGEAQRDGPSMPQGPAHDGAEPPRSRGTQLVFGCGAAFAVGEETLYKEVDITEHRSFQGRLRLSSHPEAAPWARYHFGSEFAVASMLNYSLAMDTGLTLASQGWGSGEVEKDAVRMPQIQTWVKVDKDKGVRGI